MAVPSSEGLDGIDTKAETVSTRRLRQYRHEG